MKKLRLIQITHDLAIGGLQNVIVNICQTTNREKFDISVLCLRKLGEFAPEIEKMGIKVILLPQKKNGTDYFSFLKVAKILKKEKIDVIHTHNTQPFIDGTIGALLSGVKTIIHTDHARKFPDKKRYMFAEHLMSHFAYKIVGVSEDTSQNFIKYLRINPKKVITIPNGINGQKYNVPLDKLRKKKELGIKQNGPIIGTASRLVEQKGIIYLLRAMPEVIKKFPDITLIIAGKGPCENKLRDEAGQLGIGQNVLFVGPRLDMAELLKLFDIFILPSLWEGLPMILLEAMAARCPIIATDVGGVSTAIKNSENGMLVKPKDSEALSKGIIKLLSHDNLRILYSENGLKKVRENFSAKNMTDMYEKLYLKALQNL